ncbi:MAG: hypothetical protein AAF270_06980 [Pseudomonadota bacterium]
MAAISGAGLVMYFGHASDVGLDGYHGIALEEMTLDQPIGVFVSWSCNAIFGRCAFAIRLVQRGLVSAFVGTIDPAARTQDNRALAEISADCLALDNPRTVGDWMVAIDDSVQTHDDAQLVKAWQQFRIVGNPDQPLPRARVSSS